MMMMKVCSANTWMHDVFVTKFVCEFLNHSILNLFPLNSLHYYYYYRLVI